MNTSQDLSKILKEKVTDYKRFAFILLALSVFLFIGLVVPNEGITQTHHIILISLTVLLLTFAFIFHKLAMKCQEQLFSEE